MGIPHFGSQDEYTPPVVTPSKKNDSVGVEGKTTNAERAAAALEDIAKSLAILSGRSPVRRRR